MKLSHLLGYGALAAAIGAGTALYNASTTHGAIASRVIDGTRFTAAITVDPDGVTVRYELDHPRTVPTPLRAVWHSGVSGPGPDGVRYLLAGRTTATLRLDGHCRSGQLDVKAVYIAPGDSRGRITGPTVSNTQSCSEGTTTEGVPSSPPGTKPPTTVPGVGTPPSSVTSVRSGARPPAPSTPRAGQPLPATGGSPGMALVALGSIAAGVLILMLIARRAAER